MRSRLDQPGLELNLDGFDLAELARRHDTPFYLYDLAVIERRVEALRAALPPSFRLAYAVKANPAPAVLERLASLGLGADVASGGELARALAAGFDPAQIVFTGPGKRDEELHAAVEARIGLITVESPGELHRLEAIAAAAERRVPILLRWALPPDTAEQTRIIDDGGVGKFGMDEQDLYASARLARDSAWLEFERRPWLRCLERAGRLGARRARPADDRLRTGARGGARLRAADGRSRRWPRDPLCRR